MVTLAGIALAATAASAAGAAEVGAEEIAFRLLCQLVVILFATRLVSRLAARAGQTAVSGEILAGLALGPSLLGAPWLGDWAPALLHRLFDPSTSVIFVGLAQVGLVLLMFQIGLEFEFRTHLGADRRPILAISLAGLVLPFVTGYLTAPWFHHRLGEPAPLLGFQLFFAVAMSITAIPVLGRILMELGLTRTRTAALTIGAAAIDDVLGWLILGAISLVVHGAFSVGWVLLRLAGLAVYGVGVWQVLRPLVKRALATHLGRHGALRIEAVPWLLVVLFVSAMITSALGVFAIIGGFAVGVAIHDDRRFVEEWRRRVSPLVQALFLPLFFAYTGLRTDVGTIHGAAGALTLAAACLVAFSTKFVAAYVAARAVGEAPRSACTIGVAMNTRGLMELIALNIGKDLGLLPTDIFSVLVLMALLSTFVATPLIRWLMRDQRRLAPAAPVSASAV